MTPSLRALAWCQRHSLILTDSVRADLAREFEKVREEDAKIVEQFHPDVTAKIARAIRAGQGEERCG